ncbi:5'-nucleotidase [Gloeomargarita lithophora Alchichica-D10]|uniref:5'-nucleotidase n=1 Tax=Gloeomargarita lithophora Alchichica-D10 TaxID=1188229 RepID=A0A1J0A8T6_9CYAN|nr:5'-nucleotidase [Gloeomargarita lithophora]APB32352.1 5'-nucleotidase [Gloeomargarita lithophora Alchichica-D10]
MPYSLTGLLVIGISSRALFDLSREDGIFQQEGLAAYSTYQREHEQEILPRGTAFPLVQALLKLNELTDKRLVEVIIMSRNSPDTGLRIFHAIQHYGLDITRAALTGGESIVPYFQAFHLDLLLSREESEVQGAIDAGIAAALLYHPPLDMTPLDGRVRIAFDGDAVLFSDEAELVYKQQGLAAFCTHEQERADQPLPAGPFAKFLHTLSTIQQQVPPEQAPVRIALVTARSSPAHERVIKTLRAWGVRVDAAFFLGGLTKDAVLQAFGAQIFFDDQEVHLEPASQVVPSGRVPYRSDSPLRQVSS